MLYRDRTSVYSLVRQTREALLFNVTVLSYDVCQIDQHILTATIFGKFSLSAIWLISLKAFNNVLSALAI